MHKQFKVTLKHCKPTIWRRFTLDEGASFEHLHEAIQDSFGWMSCHLWHFHETGRDMEVIAAVDFEDMEGQVAHEVPLSSFFRAPKAKCLYVYDFGDYWTHEVVFEKRVDAPDDGSPRALLAGKRACPPEDCGGPYGYDRCVHVARTGEDPYGDEAEEMLEWLGDWDPDAFDLEEARDAFDQGSFDLVAPIPGDDSGVMELVERQARARGLDEDYVDHARAIWNAYYHENGGPGRRRAKTHAACVDYVASNLDSDFMPMTQADIGRLYGVSAPSISNNYRDYGDPDEFVSRYSWAPDGVAASGGLGDGLDLMRIIAMSGDTGFVPAVAPRRPGACWLFEFDDAVPDALALVCRDGNLDVRMRVGLDELAMPSPAEIVREFLMPCVVFVQPSYVPEDVILAHPIFEACAELLEEFGARVERRYDLASPEVARPDWLDDALAARLLRALEGCAARSPALAGAYLGSVEREGGIVRFMLEVDASGRPPRWLSEPDAHGVRRAASCVTRPGDGWFEGLETSLEPRPTHLLALERFSSSAPTRELYDSYVESLEVLTALVAKYRAHPAKMPEGDLDFVPLCAHASSGQSTTYLFGPLGA